MKSAAVRWLRVPAPFEANASVSPDGHWVAFTSNESGRPEVYMQRLEIKETLTVTGPRHLVSREGTVCLRWRRDGKELFYLAPDGKLMAVDVKSSPATFEAGEPHALFSTGITTSIVDRTNNYVATRDGQRFLVNLGAEDENSAPITVVINWQSK